MALQLHLANRELNYCHHCTCVHVVNFLFCGLVPTLDLCHVKHIRL